MNSYLMKIRGEGHGVDERIIEADPDFIQHVVEAGCSTDVICMTSASGKEIEIPCNQIVSFTKLNGGGEG